jgi:hypothetical protein
VASPFPQRERRCHSTAEWHLTRAIRGLDATRAARDAPPIRTSPCRCPRDAQPPTPPAPANERVARRRARGRAGRGCRARGPPRRAARGRGEAGAPARPALWRPPSLSRPAGGDLGGRSRERPALWAVAPCRAMNRRDADLCAGRRHSWAAPARGATDLPAMRVLGAGGGGRLPLESGGRRCRGGLLIEALRRCLTQRCERQRRVHGVAHQRCERALLRAAGIGQRGEHVFGNL